MGASAMSLDETGAPLGTHPTLNHILSARDGDGRVTVRCTVVGMGSDRATREVGSLKGCAATREAALLDRFFPAPPLHMYERTSRRGLLPVRAAYRACVSTRCCLRRPRAQLGARAA